ncbi:hypothetical protein [Caldicellulosiruptor changbaiensis]|uniref:hypothetical protein n=1 Tax=Caldicellulosiruptor changbaiensis TaxID=1222016 RepID=UPI0013E0C909|nr:hypothetical protein [Caldicellulosiruptor changbaiensis]
MRTRKLYNRHKEMYNMLKRKKNMLKILGMYLTGLCKGMMLGILIGKKLKRD